MNMKNLNLLLKSLRPALGLKSAYIYNVIFGTTKELAEKIIVVE